MTAKFHNRSKQAILVAVLCLASHSNTNSNVVSAFSTPGIPSSLPSTRSGHRHHRLGDTIANSNAFRFGVPPSTWIATTATASTFTTKTTTTTTTALSMAEKVSWTFENQFLGFLAVVLAFTTFASCISIIDAGEIGIASNLGELSRYDPGPHFNKPFVTRVRTLSTKTQLLESSNYVPTKEGLTVELDTAILVRLDPDKAVELYRSVGPDFIEKLVTPEASSSVRGLTSESEAKALYTSGRSELQNRVKDELSEKLGPKGIVVEDVLLKNVVLPKDLSDSIQEKARAEQESARMEFVLQKAAQEAKRKTIEAEGISAFQKIVSEGITPSLLQWKGIEATEKLAESPNAKVVIIGNSKDSLPVILGGGNTQ